MTDIGAMLREARMREHLDIAEFEVRTKIRAKYLRALEDEEWTLLPGYTFTKAFLRTYGDMLGLDGRMLVDEFKRQYPDPSEIELAPVLPAQREARRAAQARERPGEHRASRQAGPSGRVLAVALLVVLIAAAIFVIHELDKKSKTPVASTTTTQTTSSHHHKAAPKHVPKLAKVALQLKAITDVQVCLVGYTSRHFRHQRLPAAGSTTTTALLVPGAAAPFYHEGSHFLVSFTDGSAKMVIGHRIVTVDAAGTTLAYQVGHTGAHRLSAASGPHCT